MDYYLIAAVLLDLLIGDPAWLLHPVQIIGGLSTCLERLLRGFFRIRGKIAERLAGIILVSVVVVLVYLATFYLIKLSFAVHHLLGVIVNIYLLGTTIALNGLVRAGAKVYRQLSLNDLAAARKAVALVVSRDCAHLKAEEIIRATVETLAENTSDGILAPVFFYLLGGTPLAMSYKAVNTLDSMFGYKNESYRYFGWAAARLDDLANLIPARLTGLGFCLTAFWVRQNPVKAFQTMWRDARKHPSPNAGYPEGAVAGALGVRLGGVNYYHGQPSCRAYLGKQETEFSNDQILTVIKMIYWNLGLFLFLYIIVSTLAA